MANNLPKDVDLAHEIAQGHLEVERLERRFTGCANRIALLAQSLGNLALDISKGIEFDSDAERSWQLLDRLRAKNGELWDLKRTLVKHRNSLEDLHRAQSGEPDRAQLNATPRADECCEG